MNVEPKSLAPAYTALSVGIVLTACPAIFVKIAMLPGTTTAFYRVLFAAAVAVPWCVWQRHKSLQRDAGIACW